MAINAFRSLSGIFKRCIKVSNSCVTMYVIPRRERQASDFLSVYYLFFYYNLLSLREKMAFFCLLSFFFLFFTRWGKPLIRKSSNVRSNEKEKAPRFQPRKRSQSIIIYSHCIAQNHSRTHLKKTTLDLWDYKIKV